MNKLFWTILFSFLLTSGSIAQNDCTVYGIQQLAQEYLQLDIDSVELGELGEHRFFLSNGQEVVYFLGCTDPDFVEFSPAATLNDGTCATPAIPGCTNSAYIEFLPSANVDDGSCASLNPDPTCVDSVSHWGRWYDVVLLGEQCWFAENLNAVDCEGCDGLYDFRIQPHGAGPMNLPFVGIPWTTATSMMSLEHCSIGTPGVQDFVPQDGGFLRRMILTSWRDGTRRKPTVKLLEER